jgi:hypothetical protein
LIEFRKAPLAPVQVFVFFFSGLVHRLTECLLACAKGLATVKTLCGNFSGIVNPH